MHLPVTPQTQLALTRALDEVRQRQSAHLGAEHLLLGMLSYPECNAVRILRHLHVDLASLTTDTEALCSTPQACEGTASRGQAEHEGLASPTLGSQARNTLKIAWVHAQATRQAAIGTEQVLLGMLSDPGNAAGQLLEKHKAALADVRVALEVLPGHELGPAVAEHGPVEMYLPEEARVEAPDEPQGEVDEGDGLAAEDDDKTVDFVAFKAQRELELLAQSSEPEASAEGGPTEPPAGLQDRLTLAFEQGRHEQRLETARVLLHDGIDPAFVQHYLGVRPQDLES